MNLEPEATARDSVGFRPQDGVARELLKSDPGRPDEVRLPMDAPESGRDYFPRRLEVVREKSLSRTLPNERQLFATEASHVDFGGFFPPTP
jgi:hypothetical protein